MTAAPDPAPTAALRARGTRILTWLVALAAALVAASAARAATVALVTDVVGDAALVNGASEPLTLLGELPANAEVAVGGASHAVVFYLADGGEYTLRGPGRYTLAANAPMAQKGAPAPEKKLAAAAYRDLKLGRDRAQRGGILMRGDPRPSLLQPVSEVVLDGSVTFAWEPVGDGASYQFELVDQTGQKLLIAETQDAELRLPDAVQLKPGRVYYWSLRGRDARSPQPFYRAAEFHVADIATRRRLDAARPKPDAPFSERVLYAALLEEAGAASAALAWRHTLAAERPVAWAPAR